jgi:hypothetical protein
MPTSDSTPISKLYWVGELNGKLVAIEYYNQF